MLKANNNELNDFFNNIAKRVTNIISETSNDLNSAINILTNDRQKICFISTKQTPMMC